jgi:hypothetical protein
MDTRLLLDVEVVNATRLTSAKLQEDGSEGFLMCVRESPWWLRSGGCPSSIASDAVEKPGRVGAVWGGQSVISEGKKKGKARLALTHLHSFVLLLRYFEPAAGVAGFSGLPQAPFAGVTTAVEERGALPAPPEEAAGVAATVAAAAGVAGAELLGGAAVLRAAVAAGAAGTAGAAEGAATTAAAGACTGGAATCEGAAAATAAGYCCC